jgi:16S rRNA G1207 methylase RsmC
MTDGFDGGIDAVILDRMTDTLMILQCKQPTEDRAAMIAALKAVRDKADEDVKLIIVVEGKTDERGVQQFLATLNRTSIGANDVYVARANASARRVADVLGRVMQPPGKSA